MDSKRGKLSVFLDWLIEVDHKIVVSLNSLHNPLLKVFFKIITLLGSATLWIPVYIISLIYFKGNYFAFTTNLIFAEVMGYICIIIVKYATKRERPIPELKSPFLNPWNRYSFPSHHSLRAFLIVMIVILHYELSWSYLFLISALVAFSRLYLKKHFFTDVFVGTLFGIFIAVYSFLGLSSLN